MLDQTNFDVDLETKVFEGVVNGHHNRSAGSHLLGHHLLSDTFMPIVDFKVFYCIRAFFHFVGRELGDDLTGGIPL